MGEWYCQVEMAERGNNDDDDDYYLPDAIHIYAADRTTR